MLAGRSRANTRAPLPARAVAVAWPRPDAPPVTTAEVFSSCMVLLSVCGSAAAGRRDRGGGRPGERATDHHPLDLVGALEDLHDLGLAHVALDREVAGVAVAAVDLHGVRGDLHGVVGRHHLR